MKILFLTDCFLPHAGGARVYYHNLYTGLASHLGHTVTILTTLVPGSKEFDADHATRHYQIIRKGRPLADWRWFRWPRLVPVLVRALLLIKKLRPDAIHFGDLFPQGFTCLLLNRFFAFEYVGYCHGEEITQTDKRRFQPLVRNAIYARASMVIAASDFAVRNLIRIGVAPERIVKINPGVNCQRLATSERDRAMVVDRHQLHGRRVLLTVSRLCSHKGHALVIRALSQLLPRIPSLCYLIVGRGAEEQRLKALAAELGVTHAVRFAGFVPDELLPAYYGVCDVFVMPSYEESETGNAEGFGMVFLEAGAAGKPVIAGASGGTDESVLEGITGYRVADVPELIDRLSSILEDPAHAQQIGEQGSARVRAEFAWTERTAALDRLVRMSVFQSQITTATSRASEAGQV